MAGFGSRPQVIIQYIDYRQSVKQPVRTLQ